LRRSSMRRRRRGCVRYKRNAHVCIAALRG
jgi:hypothetical protein